MDYKASGVDIDAGNEVVRRIKHLARGTATPGVLSDLGSFGGMFALDPSAPDGPVLVASADGVGTKLKVAFLANRHDTIGEDLVNHCVNDILVQGARPLFFLDYLATGRLSPDVAVQIVEGVARGCRANGCALLGGETAEMPGMYAAKHYDLAGFCVGAVERERLIDGTKVRAGDVLLGLASSGVHSNGYSLVRAILARSGQALDSSFGDGTLADALLTPTRIYVKPLLKALATVDIHALAHITGGGLTENIPRVIPDGLSVHIDLNNWRLPALFTWLRDAGQVAQAEMLKTFNCGIGMVVVVAPEDFDSASRVLGEAGEQVCRLGTVVEGGDGVSYSGTLA